MIGMIDMGGGMRGVYTAGIYDYLLDQKITIDYGIDVYKRQEHTLLKNGAAATWYNTERYRFGHRY